MVFPVVKLTVVEADTVMCSSGISYNDDHNHNNYDTLKLTSMFSDTHTYTYTFTDPSSTQVGLNLKFAMERAELKHAIKSKQ